MLAIIEFFKLRKALGVFVITFLVYSPLLFNQYVGDDHVVMENNTFYHSWKNIPRVFGKGSIADNRDMIYHLGHQFDFGTGKDCYRPISNLTYFLDYYLFRSQPYGSHLIGILIHCVNAILVFWIVNQIFSSSTLGVFAALLFSLHPLQSEAVSVMSYRADILAAMFTLLSFFFWFKFKLGRDINKKYYFGSLVMYFFSVFSKEEAFILPLVIILFDQLLGVKFSGLKQRKIWYLGFLPIFLFFLYLYFYVNPPFLASLSFHWLGGSFFNQCLLMSFIWANYLSNIFMPWTVKMIPGMYCPPVPHLFSFATAEIGVILILMLKFINVIWRDSKECLFFICWYILFYLPLSNLFPIANPMACRYMYLPSIGLLIPMAYFLHKAFESAFLKNLSQNLSKILYGAIIMICVMRSIYLFGDWKNDFNVGWACMRDYPADGQGYALIAQQFYHAKHFDKAKEYFEKSIILGNRKIEDGIGLVECYMYLGETEKAEALLKRITSRHSYFDDVAFLYLGEIYYYKGDNQKAVDMLRKSLALNPNEAVALSYLTRSNQNLILGQNKR